MVDKSPTERIELPDGGWWEFYTVCTRGMRKAFRRAGVQSFAKGMDGAGRLDNPDAMRLAMLAHPDRWDLDMIDDAYLLHGTKAYSYGDSVSLETIDELPDSIVQEVLARMRLLYAEIPEETRKNS